MSNQDIFEKELKGLDGTLKKISEIIDIEKHTWTTENGNIIMKHEAILRLRKHTGARFLKPELQSEISNPGNVVFLCAVEFPDGEISFEIGESNNENTKGWSKGIKPTMAFKRGYDRAFLRSDYISLFEVYSEEESEDFKKPVQYAPEQIQNQGYNEEFTDTDAPEQTNEGKESPFPPYAALFLPGTDLKYPGQHIIDDVLKRHKDLDYFRVILETYPNNPDYVVTVNLIQKMRENKLKKALQEKSNNEIPAELKNSELTEDAEAIISTEEENPSTTSNKEIEPMELFTIDDEQLQYETVEISEEKIKGAEYDAEAFLAGMESEGSSTNSEPAVATETTTEAIDNSVSQLDATENHSNN